MGDDFCTCRFSEQRFSLYDNHTGCMYTNQGIMSLVNQVNILMIVYGYLDGPVVYNTGILVIFEKSLQFYFL